MSSGYFWTRGWTLLLMLVLVPLMTAASCTTIPTTGQPSAAARRAADSITADICRRAWRPTSHDSELDTPETVESSRANNRARAAFCAGVE